MLSHEDYLRNAEECHLLAKSMRSKAHQEALMRMASTWEQLALKAQQKIVVLDIVSEVPAGTKGNGADPSK